MPSLQCPSCGNYSFDPEKQCICGYQVVNPAIVETEKIREKSEEEKTQAADNSSRRMQTDHNVIKEIDSWYFTFSEPDKCIYLGTPPLQSFRLKLTLSDIEELLEFLYRKTGKEKTIRKLHLRVDEIPDVINIVRSMIEQKRSKIPIKFDAGEMKEIADLINMKLKA
ncbi:MAG: hypothetical protein AB1499_16555 [Nitrospirota bacterium]